MQVRHLVDEYIEDTTESRLEHEYVQLVVAAGLPRPTPQHEIRDMDGSFVARTDNAWVAERVLAEIDSVRHHLHRQAFEEDRRKRNRLRVMGWLVLEFTARMIRRRPDQVLRDTAEALAARR